MFTTFLSAITAIAFSLCTNNSTTSNIDFDAALHQKLITVKAIANPDGTHYLNPLIIQVKNISNTSIRVHLPVGYSFTPVDTNTQALIVLEPQLMVLAPFQTYKKPIAGACINASKGGPANQEAYLPTGKASKNLLGLAEYAYEQKINNLGLQEALWCISDNRQLTDIASYDTLTDVLLQKKVASLLGVKVPPRPKFTDYANNYYAPIEEIKRKFGGKYDFKISFPMDIIIGMYNTDGVIVRELMNKKNVESGTHSFSFEFDGATYTDPEYRFILTANGVKCLYSTIKFSDG